MCSGLLDQEMERGRKQMNGNGKFHFVWADGGCGSTDQKEEEDNFFWKIQEYKCVYE